MKKRGRRPVPGRVVLGDEARTILYSAARAMKILGVHRTLFYRLVRAGTIPARQWGTVLVGGPYSGWDTADEMGERHVYVALADLRAYHARRCAWLKQHGRTPPHVSKLLL